MILTNPDWQEAEAVFVFVSKNKSERIREAEFRMEEKQDQKPQEDFRTNVLFCQMEMGTDFTNISMQ